jgi:hypothetical protein
VRFLLDVNVLVGLRSRCILGIGQPIPGSGGKSIGLRNIPVHHYFEIDEELIWQVVEQDLRPFRETAEVALRKLEAQQR